MKVTKTYSIEESIYSAFDSLTTEKNINKSSAIEEYIRKFLKDNDMDFIDKLYCLKTDPDRMVTVVSQDTTYYFLNDGSKMQKILFLHLFKECDIINPNEFFKKSTPILEGIAEKIKSIDESKVSYFDGQEGRSFKSKVSDLTNKGTLDKLLDQLADRSYPEDKFEIKREQKDILNEINNKNDKNNDFSPSSFHDFILP